VWLVDRDAELAGSLALTVESEGVGRVRWFVLAAQLRGRGLGRTLLDELVAKARDDGFDRLVLDTFSALRAAAHLYRQAGFRVCGQRDTDQWGPQITYQRYELGLR
jgi:ribosomal protein S18 acetylase RimI-like enzyme